MESFVKDAEWAHSPTLMTVVQVSFLLVWSNILTKINLKKQFTLAYSFRLVFITAEKSGSWDIWSHPQPEAEYEYMEA